MTINPENNQETPKPTDKELNFRALEARMQQERAAKLEAEKKAAELEQQVKQYQSRQIQNDDDQDDEPYVDHKKLEKKLSNFERKLEEKIDKKAEEKARFLLEKDKQENYIRNNPDFYDVLQHAETFARHDPELAETILQMPEGFERQKLVYKNIKALGLHKPKPTEPTIQQKIDANRRSPYYQPTDVNSAPYASAGDFSPIGQKNAYTKMQELKNKLRL